jgi:cytochrome P450
LLPNAVEELLRYDSPIQVTGRLATEDIALDRATIGAGDWMTLLIGAANHDPRSCTGCGRCR